MIWQTPSCGFCSEYIAIKIHSYIWIWKTENFASYYYTLRKCNIKTNTKEQFDCVRVADCTIVQSWKNERTESLEIERFDSIELCKQIVRKFSIGNIKNKKITKNHLNNFTKFIRLTESRSNPCNPHLIKAFTVRSCEIGVNFGIDFFLLMNRCKPPIVPFFPVEKNCHRKFAKCSTFELVRIKLTSILNIKKLI